MPDEVVDFGLLSKRINPEIEGIREDSLIALQREYPSREEAAAKIPEHLLGLQKLRGEMQAEENTEAIMAAGKYLVDSYMNNIWPKMNVLWGTYSEHLGHKYYDDNGFGCFRCHDEEHISEAGNYIKMDCDLCHDEPE